MSEPTKACNLTEDEIKGLISRHGFNLNTKHSKETIERINYLIKRLKAFSDPVADVGQAVASTTDAAGWSSTNGS